MDRYQLQDALIRASESHKLVAIAKEINIPAHAIHQFVSSGSLGEERRKKLETWLLGHGYGPENGAPSVRKVMAQELRLVASVLDNPDISDEIAGQRFQSLFDAYGRALDRARQSQKE